MYEPTPYVRGVVEIEADGSERTLPEIPEIVFYLDENLPKIVEAMNDLACACNRRGLMTARVAFSDEYSKLFRVNERYDEMARKVLEVL